MNLRRGARIARILACLAISLGITASVYLLDDQREGIHEAIAALRWARQVASQAEGMTLRARESGENDPIGFAVNYLAQGVEPRLIKIGKYQGAPAELQTPELFHLDREAGIFDYSKILNTDDLSGVRVQLTVGTTGFLGTRSKLAGDLAVAIVFLAGFAILFLASMVLWDSSGDPRLRKLVQGWSSESKGHLTQLGAHIRELVRGAQQLAVASNRSHQTIAPLREKIHAQITAVHESRKQLREAGKLASQAESIALSAAIEANRLGPEGKRVAEMVQSIHQLVHRSGELGNQCGGAVEELERQLEPWATDVDLAFHAYDETARATSEMQLHIRKTTEMVLGQAKLLQKLNQELSSSASGGATGAHAGAGAATSAARGANPRPSRTSSTAVPAAPSGLVGEMPEPLPDLSTRDATVAAAVSPRKPRAPRKRSPKKAA